MDDQHVYTWNEDIPEDAKHIRVDKSITQRTAGWERTFQGHDLVTVDLVVGLRYISRYAFYMCLSLETVNVPSTVQGIGEGAFRSCQSLVNLTLNEGLKRIGNKVCLAGCLTRICHDVVLPFSRGMIRLFSLNVRSLNPSPVGSKMKTIFFILFFLHRI